ncbi:DMT family transporter [Luteipulveratus flavus]|uniref:DMT family transporter n=1 Tax=Luteipulveratus flavus TaxID=3031728 RepID=A0ABT6C7H0_9MICO|nr:DMT family transporter [Luteipulveratus sp. YIM 133296]MDF8264888.1 DMT family transporter [Luteipulveratus sp. YIM 133296]
MTSCTDAVHAASDTPVAEPTPRSTTPAVLAAGVTIVLWASSFVVIRSAGAHLAAGPMALLRVLVAALVLTPLVLRRRTRPLLPRGRALGRVVAYGVMWFAADNVVLTIAERHVDAGTAALLVNVAPILMAVGAGLFLGEGFPRPVVVGSLIGLVGVAVMTLGTGDEGSHADAVGLVLGLVAAMLYATSVLLQKVTLREIDGLHATWLGTLVGVVATLPFAGQLVGELASAPPSALLGAAYLGAFPTAVAFTTYAYALTHMSAGRIGPLVGYLATVVSVLMSWLFLDEVPTTLTLLGGAICIAGVVVSRRRSAR